MTEYIEQFWRAATPADSIKEPPMVARFRQDDEPWVHTAQLLGYDRARLFKWSCSMGENMTRCFRHCEVYDEPDWHKNKPDPGEGYRLLEKLPEPESLVDGDQWGNTDGAWFPTTRREEGQVPEVWYRRKIAANAAEAPPAPTEPDDEPQMDDHYRLQESDIIQSGDRFINDDGDPEDAYTTIGMMVSNTSHTYFRPVVCFRDNAWHVMGKKLDKRHYAVMNASGYYLTDAEVIQWTKDIQGVFSPEGISKLNHHLLTCCELVPIAISHVDPFKAKIGGPPVKVAEAAKVVGEVSLHPIDLKDKWLFKGTPIEDRSYAVLDEHGHYLRWIEGREPEFKAEFIHAFTPGLLFRMSERYLQNIRLRAIAPVDVDRLKQGPEPVKTEPTYEIGKVYEYVNRKFRLATEADIGKAVLRSDHSLEQSFHMPQRKLEGVVSSNGKLQYASRGYWKYAFIEITEPEPPKYVQFEWEDRHLLKNRYIRRKGELYRESCVQDLDQEQDGTCVVRLKGSIYDFAGLLEKCEFDDGTPCGKRVDNSDTP